MQRFHKTAPPDEKMFIASTSGGSIQVRNALMMTSLAVRNRVISIAPFFDHSFISPTYNKVLRQNINKFIDDFEGVQ